MVAERLARPKDDLITALAQVEAGGDRLTTGEMIATLTVLLIAGHETTVNLLANGVLSLTRQPRPVRGAAQRSRPRAARRRRADAL